MRGRPRDALRLDYGCCMVCLWIGGGCIVVALWLFFASVLSGSFCDLCWMRVCKSSFKRCNGALGSSSARLGGDDDDGIGDYGDVDDDWGWRC